MKKFILKIVIFFILAYITPILLFNSIGSRAGRIVFSAISKSNKNQGKKIKKLLLGDSVGNQIFNVNNYNDSLYSLCSNQAITLAGNYFLLKNFLETNPTTEGIEVALIFTPFTLQNDLNQIFTFHYFLKSFNISDYGKEFTSKTHEQINKIPYSYLAQFPPIKYSNWAPAYEPTPNAKTAGIISDFNAEYLLKIQDLCEKRNIKLNAFCPAIPLSKKDTVTKIKVATLPNVSLKSIFEHYWDTLELLDDQLFVDGVHYNLEKVNLNNLKVVKAIK